MIEVITVVIWSWFVNQVISFSSVLKNIERDQQSEYSIQNDSRVRFVIAITEIMYTLCTQKLYKMYTFDVYPYLIHILKKFCIHLVHKIKRSMAAKYVYKMYTKD